MIKRLLLIGDSHAQAGVPNTRYEMLGRYIAHKRPDVILQIGDFADMTSLSLYDVGKRKAEGQRYDLDIKAAIDANEKLFRPIHQLNIRLKHQKKQLYKPKLYLTLGNHENRVSRAANNDPKLFGTLTIENLKYEKFGWEVVPFLEPLVLEGVHFCHYFPTGLKEFPISGANAARTLAMLDGSSKVAGHSHLLQCHYEGTGKSRWGLVAGCYLDPEHQIKGSAMDYVSAYTRQKWWNGIILLHSVHNGTFDPVFVPYSYIKENYGK
jgi:hypothetical protein